MSSRERNLRSVNRFSGLISRVIILGLLVSTSSLFAQVSNPVNYSDNTELLKSANLAFETGDFNRAVAEFSILYDRFPEDPTISNNYSIALFKAGQHADAAAVIQEFLTEHSEVGEITNNLFTIYDYLASESYALLNGVEPDLPDLRLSDSAPNIVTDIVDAERPSIETSVIVNTVNQGSNQSQPIEISPVRNESIETSAVSPVNGSSNSSTDLPDELADRVNEELNKVSLESALEVSLTVPVAGDEDLLEARLNDYILAWTEGDVNRYLSFYYPGVSPVAGVSYNDWRQSRIDRIFPEREIELSIDELRVHFESAEDVIMEYMQRYRSRNYSDRTLKQMRWRKYQGVWYIRNEKSLPR